MKNAHTTRPPRMQPTSGTATYATYGGGRRRLGGKQILREKQFNLADKTCGVAASSFVGLKKVQGSWVFNGSIPLKGLYPPFA